MENALASGAEIVLHVGPEPKLFPTGFDRLSNRIMKQLKMRHLDRLGSSVIPSISRNSWLNSKAPCKCCPVAGSLPEPYHSGGLAARAGGLLIQTEHEAGRTQKGGEDIVCRQFGGVQNWKRAPAGCLPTTRFPMETQLKEPSAKRLSKPC